MRLKLLLFITTTALLFAGTAFAAPKAAGKMRDFSATLVIVEKDNTSRAKFFYTKNKQRMEVKDDESGGKSVIITRLDKELVWMLMTAEKMYMEMPIEQGKDNPLTEDPDMVVKREKLG